MSKKVRVRNLNGYRVVFCPKHPKAMKNDNWKGFVYEHIVVAEEFMGRPLRETEEVHHLNFDRSNNDPRNLLVLEKSQHTKLHHWLNIGAPRCESSGLNGKNSKNPKAVEPSYCVQCERVLTRGQKKFCNRECSSAKSMEGWPSKDELAADIESLSWLAIGRKYGVSDNAARKWARKYELLR